MASTIIEARDTTNQVTSPVTGTLSGSVVALDVSDKSVHPGDDATTQAGTQGRNWGGNKADSKTSCTGDTQIKATAGYYYGYSVTVATATAAISIYDNTAESGTVVDVIPATTAAGTTKSLATPIPMGTGIYCGYGASATGTVVILFT